MIFWHIQHGPWNSVKRDKKGEKKKIIFRHKEKRKINCRILWEGIKYPLEWYRSWYICFTFRPWKLLNKIISISFNFFFFFSFYSSLHLIFSIHFNIVSIWATISGVNPLKIAFALSVFYIFLFLHLLLLCWCGFPISIVEEWTKSCNLQLSLAIPK